MKTVYRFNQVNFFHKLMHIIDTFINRLERDGNPLSCPVDRNNLIPDKVSDLC